MQEKIKQFIALAQWAFDNNDKYLSDRAHEQILKLCKNH